MVQATSVKPTVRRLLAMMQPEAGRLAAPLQPTLSEVCLLQHEATTDV
jgi:hypothetical protein